jgi:hypothetical protein
MSGDEIRLVVPATEGFRRIAHLVTGGLALRLDVTYDDLEDLQVALETLLALRDDDDDLTLRLSTAGGVLRASVGPFAPEALHGVEPEAAAALDVRRVLEAVCDTHEVEEREDGVWVELSKRIASPAGAGR